MGQMVRAILSLFFAIGVTLTSTTLCIAKKSARVTVKPFLLERTPTHVPYYQPERTRAALNNDKVWPAGSTLTVAFLGGSDEEREKVVELATSWSKYAKIKFDFLTKPDGPYREWSTDDRKYSAQVRIAFDESGFWSAVGKDSLDREQFPQNKPSMNLDMENCSEEELPTSVLHEFGHALGFLHEHQRPDLACNKEFRWEDDPGYVPTKDLTGMFMEDAKGRLPGVYTWCSGPPNRMTREWIEKNMRSLPKSSAYSLGPKDRDSIMHYHFPEFFFVKGKDSPCFAEGCGQLSKYDIQGVTKAYPEK